MTLLAFMLGTGLATAQAQAPNIPGVNANRSDNGAHIDPSAIERACRRTTTDDVRDHTDDHDRRP